MLRIQKKDRVRVISGKDKNKEGEVLKVWPKVGRVFVSGVNMARRHLKSREGVQGGIISVERPLDVSKLVVICKVCQKPSAVGFKIENGRKQRVCKQCQGVL